MHGAQGGEAASMDRESVEYFRARERIERAAASNATSEAARRAHLELAQGYAALVRQADGTDLSGAVASG